MSEPRNRPSYQEIIARDPTPPPAVLTQRSNPDQSTADIPFSHYISQEFFDLEMAHMWTRVWQIACREEHIPEQGDFLVGVHRTGSLRGPHAGSAVAAQVSVRAWGSGWADGSDW